VVEVEGSFDVEVETTVSHEDNANLYDVMSRGEYLFYLQILYIILYKNIAKT
jgi:hypothetical protein